MTRVVICVLALVLSSSSVRGQDAARSDGWVVLPIEQYRALRASAYPSPVDPLVPPIETALTRVDYDLRVAGESVSGEVRLTIDVLKQGWVSVHVPPGLLVREASLDGRRTALVDGTPPRVLISTTGRSTLTLSVVVPLSISSGIESMTLPPSGSALSEVTLTIPRTSVELTVNGGFVATQTESDTENRWLVYGSPGKPLGFSWKRKVDDRRLTLPLRLRARIIELVALAEETSQVTASVHVEATQGVARQMSLSLPEGLVVNQVQGATVGDWNQLQTTLTVFFIDPLAGETSFVVSGEARVAREGSVIIPILRVPAAERETGGIAVDVVGPGEIGNPQPRGIEAADASDLGDIVSGRESPSMAAFRFKPMPGSAPRELAITVTRYTLQAVPVANVEEARYDALLNEDGKVLVRARYAVRNNQRSFLAIALPPRSTLWSAALSGRPVRPGLSPTGALLLPMQKGPSSEDAPTFVVELTYLQRSETWFDSGTVRLELPALDLPVSRSGISLRHSPRYELAPRPGSFRLSADPGPWSPTLRAESLPSAAPTSREMLDFKASEDMRRLVDRFQQEIGRTSAGIVPVQIQFPDFGSTLFLASELTPETQFPSLELRYKLTRNRR